MSLLFPRTARERMDRAYLVYDIKVIGLVLCVVASMAYTAYRLLRALFCLIHL